MNPKSIANSSGFPLQIRVGHVAKSSKSWNLFVQEHPWRSIDTNNEGFIDLVLIDDNKTQAMVVECKRVRQASWVFLIPNINCKERTHVRLWITDQSGSDWPSFGWINLQAIPSYESMFCAIPGQEHGRQNLIERTGAELIEATESLAFQEKELADKYPPEMRYFMRIYIPVIITTAELKVSCFDPSIINLSDGELPEGTEFTTVPYIRFRKSFTSIVRPDTKAETIKDIYSESERTIFIVNAEHVEDFLNSWEIDS